MGSNIYICIFITIFFNLSNFIYMFITLIYICMLYFYSFIIIIIQFDFSNLGKQQYRDHLIIMFMAMTSSTGATLRRSYGN